MLLRFCSKVLMMVPQIAKFMGPTWGPPGSCRPQMGPMLAPRTLLSGTILYSVFSVCHCGLPYKLHSMYSSHDSHFAMFFVSNVTTEDYFPLWHIFERTGATDATTLTDIGKWISRILYEWYHTIHTSLSVSPNKTTNPRKFCEKFELWGECALYITLWWSFND